MNAKHGAVADGAVDLEAAAVLLDDAARRRLAALSPGAIHPLVARHPMTGKPSLYIGRRPNAWIVGLSDEESEQLLNQLWDHIDKSDHTWAQEWQSGDVVLWDNRCTLHRRGPLDPAQRRRMHRTQIRDEARPTAA